MARADGVHVDSGFYNRHWRRSGNRMSVASGLTGLALPLGIQVHNLTELMSL